MNVWGKFSEGGKWFFLILKQHQFLKYLDYDFLFSAAIFCFSPKNKKNNMYFDPNDPNVPNDPNDPNDLNEPNEPNNPNDLNDQITESFADD